MSDYITLHPENPQPRGVDKVVGHLRSGGVMAYPTDTGYALGCMLDNQQGLERITKIRNLMKNHQFSLVCSSLSEAAHYAMPNNADYRLMKRLLPGPYTFILKAQKKTPKKLYHPKKKTLGIRVPDHATTLSILESLGCPLLSSTLILPGESLPEIDPQSIYDRLSQHLDLVVDGGMGLPEFTSVIDLSEGQVDVVREGLGDLSECY